MAGLLGSLIAGGTKGFAQGRLKDIERREEFDMRKELMDAEVEKQVLLKKLGYQMDDERSAALAEKRGAYFADVDEETKTPESVMQKYTDENGNEVEVKSGGETVKTSRQASISNAAERAIKAGDLEYGKGLLSLSGKEKTFDSVKLDDGSVMAFDKSTGQGKIISEGGKTTSFKTIEEAIVNEKDPTKRAELISIKKQIAIAGRAPGSEGQDPADVKSAKWLVNQGVAKNATEAWGLVKQTKGKSPSEAISDLTSKLLAGDSLGRKYKTTDDAIAEAKRIYKSLSAMDSADGGESDPSPAGKPWDRKW